jgi:hypothetical protein
LGGERADGAGTFVGNVFVAGVMSLAAPVPDSLHGQFRRINRSSRTSLAIGAHLVTAEQPAVAAVVGVGASKRRNLWLRQRWQFNHTFLL